MNLGYFEPTKIDELIDLKRELGEEAFFLGGGTYLNSSLSSCHPSNLISLAKVDFGKIVYDQSEWGLPANCTIQEILDTKSIPDALAQACRNIRNRNIRNMATIGGHLALSDCCSDLLPTLVSMDSLVEVYSLNDKSLSIIPIIEYVSGRAEPSLISRVVILRKPRRRVAVANYRRNSNGRSIVCVAVSSGGESKSLDRPIIAIGGVAGSVIRLFELENDLNGGEMPSSEDLQQRVQNLISPKSDLKGSGGLKKQLAGVLVQRSLEEAVRSLQAVSG